MMSRSEQQPGRMAEEEKQESDSHAPSSGPPVPECNLNRPSREPQAAEIEKTCWQRFLGSRLVVFCLGLPESRVAMIFYALLALSPVVDILSDVLTAANFALRGHPWWATTTMVVFYMSGRFTVVFMALCPTPSAWNLMCLYLPGCWLLLKGEETPGAAVAENPAFVVRGGESGAGAGNPLGDPQPRPPHDQQPEAGIQRPAGAPRPTTQANPQLVRMTRNRFTTRVYDVLTVAPQEFDDLCPCTICGVALAMEIVLIPFACLAIIPIGISAFSLAGSYLAAGMLRCPSPALMEGLQPAPMQGFTQQNLQAARRKTNAARTTHSACRERRRCYGCRCLYRRRISAIERKSAYYGFGNETHTCRSDAEPRRCLRWYVGCRHDRD